MLKMLSKLNGLILTIVFLILMYMVYTLNLLPAKYFLLVGGILLLFVLLFDFKLIRKKTGFISRIIYNVMSIIFIVVSIFAMTYVNATNHFLKNVIADNFETITYDLLVNSNGSFTHVGDLYNQDVSYLSTDKYYKIVKPLIRKDVKYKEKKYTDVDSFEQSIEKGNTLGMIINDSYYEILKEEYPEFASNTKIIKQYKITVPKTNSKNEQVVKKTSKEPFLVYISGIDTYGNISSVSRSDVNILAAVNPNTGKVLLVNIPRDYYVQLHGTTGIRDKLTHAGIYGIDTSINTIDDLLNTKIDYFVRINFSTLTKMIDTIDGVDVYSDTTFVPHTNRKITIQEGMNHLDGEGALAFSRERYAYSSGDRHRGMNQQAVIEAIIKKMSNVEYVSKYKDILTSLDGTFETSMTYEEMTDLFKMQLSKKTDWQVESISLDGTGSMLPTYSMGSRPLYVMIPDQSTIDNAKTRLDEYLK